MMMRKNAFAALLTTVLLVGSTAPALAQGKSGPGKPPDEVVLKGGNETRKGEVKDENTKFLTLEVAGKEQKIEWKDISSVNYGGTPQQIMPGTVIAAEQRLLRGDKAGAEREADDATKDCTSERQVKLFLPRAKLALAKARRALGRFADAAKAAEEVCAASPNSRYAPDAWAERVLALAQALDDTTDKVHAEAKAKADEGGESFVLAANGNPAIEEIDLAAAGFFEKKGKTLEAKTLYSKHEGSARPSVRDRATLGRGRIALAEGQGPTANKIFERLKDSATDPDAKAGALVGLGDAEVQKATAAAAKEKGALLRGALQFYLLASVLETPVGGGSSENHENSLRQAGACIEKILETLPKAKDPESREEKARKFWADYARKQYEELIKTYQSAKDEKEIRAKIEKLRKASSGGAPAAPAPGKS